MSVVAELHRGNTSQVAAYTGAVAEPVANTTTQQLVMQDGSTAGGWPHDLAVRTAVSNANYTAKVTDRIIAYTAISVARTVSLLAAASFPTGTTLIIVDESGSCSATATITPSPNGADTIVGGVAVLSTGYGFIALESNGATKWTIVAGGPYLTGAGALMPVQTQTGASYAFAAADLQKMTRRSNAGSAMTDTFPASTAQGLANGSIIELHNYDASASDTITAGSGTTINGGSSAVVLAGRQVRWVFDQTATNWRPDVNSFSALVLNRQAVSDANATLSAGSSIVAYTAITAARAVSLVAAAAVPAGTQLLIVDESGSCSASKTITASRAGSDTINGGTSAVLNQAYAYAVLESNGSNAWTVVDRGPSVSSVNGLTGSVTLTPTDGTVLSASGSTILFGAPGGLVNKFRNGTMDVWQRGSSVTATTSGGYTADGWIVVPTGASLTAAQATGRALTRYALQVTGSSTVTDFVIKQRIESYVAAALSGQTVTVQARIFNGVGSGSFTPKLTVTHPSTQDPSTALASTYANTDVNAASLQACANGTWTQVAYSFAANANSINGLEIIFDFGAAFSGALGSPYVQITELDIRVTPGAAAGLNATPPPPELRPITAELQFCLRYYEVVGWGQGIAYVSTSISMAKSFQVEKRAVPAIALLTTAPTIIQFTVGTFTGSGSALVGGGTSAQLDGVSVGISGFTGLSASALAPVFSTTAALLSASAEL